MSKEIVKNGVYFFKSYRKVERRKKISDGILPACSTGFRNSVAWKVAGFYCLSGERDNRTLYPFQNYPEN